MNRASAKAVPTGMPEINLTPMIDVVFQLIIFFMCAMKFKTLAGKLEMNLPKTHGTDTSPQPLPDVVKVTVALRQEKSEGVPRLEMMGEGILPGLGLGLGPLPRVPRARGQEEKAERVLAHHEAVYRQYVRPKLDELSRRARAVHESDATVRWEVSADPVVRHEYVVGLLDALCAAGIDNIDIRGTKGPAPGR